MCLGAGSVDQARRRSSHFRREWCSTLGGSPGARTQLSRRSSEMLRPCSSHDPKRQGLDKDRGNPTATRPGAGAGPASASYGKIGFVDRRYSGHTPEHYVYRRGLCSVRFKRTLFRVRHPDDILAVPIADEESTGHRRLFVIRWVWIDRIGP